ncbi:glycosyl hydrolase family 18 protein [Lipingzhangella sp. LS1_29]|uniref:chitinase n=1 Tax=Lipingzhangella rawalii TaxID=2055835 RepID=A0ABU2H5A3_9ACTN|nr:glycosyl hydrolase family 18 protein [Lipingzhangella rawalii]MDS1270493.1 glycosyl hydrolase family 18 protein [Lipingzhangella rawalii]
MSVHPSPIRRGAAAMSSVLLLAPMSVLLGGPAAADTSAPDTTSTANTANSAQAPLEVTHTERARWPSGYQAGITIANPGTEDVGSWTLEIELPDDASIHQLWNASVTETSDNTYEITPPHWGGSVPAGGEYSFGYNGAFSDGDTELVSCTINGLPCSGTEPDPEYRQVGYFTQWGAEDEGYLVRDLVETGQAEQLTHLNYAFVNLDEDGRCFATDAEGEGEAYSDYGRTYTAEESVDGVADDPDADLRGNFNQLRKLKEMYPELEVHLAIGGWEWSTYFSNAALPENREASVESCIDMYLRGNLPELNDAGGDGAAAGLFDGIDLDWEWPGSPGAPGNVVREEDRENFTALVQEYRDQLDDLEDETGNSYGLSAFVPANEQAIDAGYELDQLMDNFDFINTQGYDLYGAWSPTTGHQGNLHPAENDPLDSPRGAATVVQEYLDRGVEPEDIVMGVPFYGRGWQGVDPGPNGDGLWQDHEGAAPGEREDGYNDFHVLEDLASSGQFELYRDEEAGTAWIYDGDQLWNYDDAIAIAQKAAWVRDAGLSGAMVWSLDGDNADGALMTALHEELNGH